jgi:hypothetical protein
MPFPVLPTHFRGRNSGFTSNGSMHNILLRVGEVQAIYYPGDENNDSGKFVEYDVWVGHRANGTAVTKMYRHVIAIDHFGSMADFSFATYRAKKTSTNQDPAKELAPGMGAKVILLCISGETNNAIILGGIRDVKGTKDALADGHNLHSVFNGIDLSVNKDGELLVTYNGATGPDGQPAPGTDTDGSGTYIKVDKKGNFTVSDGNGDNLVFIDRVNGKVRVQAANEIDVVADKVRLGDDQTTDPAVLGNELKDILTQLIGAIETLTVFTPMGPSSVPINNPAFEQVKAKLGQILSDTVYVK